MENIYDRAEDALFLLENEVFKRVIAECEKNITERWLCSKSPEEREIQFYRARALEDIVNMLMDDIGSAASDETKNKVQAGKWKIFYNKLFKQRN